MEKKGGFGSSILLILFNSEKKMVPKLSETNFLPDKKKFFIWKTMFFPHSKPKKKGFEWKIKFGFLNNSNNQ